MRVTVLLFARLRELVGEKQVDLDLPDGADAAAAFAALAGTTPGLGELRPKIRCAVDGEYRGWESVLGDGAELALIPPTAGG